jgi:hypothetical protein
LTDLTHGPIGKHIVSMASFLAATVMKESKQFFFEKKNQKTFTTPG